jgi:hypothetical protein
MDVCYEEVRERRTWQANIATMELGGETDLHTLSNIPLIFESENFPAID